MHTTRGEERAMKEGEEAKCRTIRMKRRSTSTALMERDFQCHRFLVSNFLQGNVTRRWNTVEFGCLSAVQKYESPSSILAVGIQWSTCAVVWLFVCGSESTVSGRSDAATATKRVQETELHKPRRPKVEELNLQKSRRRACRRRNCISRDDLKWRN